MQATAIFTSARPREGRVLRVCAGQILPSPPINHTLLAIMHGGVGRQSDPVRLLLMSVLLMSHTIAHVVFTLA